MTRELSLTFGTLLRHYRRAAGFTQEELAEHARLSVRGISDLERDVKQRPRPETVALLAGALSLTVEEHRALADAARPKGNPSVAPVGNDTPTTLPLQPTPFIGRVQEAATIQHALLQPHVRLLTLTGPGGIGKTRLALHVAVNVHAAFRDGIYFVPLAPLQDATLLLPTIARTLGVRHADGQSLEVQVQDALRDKHILLILDNAEHVLDAVPMVALLLSTAPHLKVLATSRAALHLTAEHEFPVPPLLLPTITIGQDIDVLATNDAVALFLSRAQAVKPDFVLTPTNARAVVEICSRLDGLPLAIELAAVRSKAFTPRALLERLGNRLAFLTHGPQDLPQRQRTLRSTIAWSYQLLNSRQQSLFVRLAVFEGGGTGAAIQAVVGMGQGEEPQIDDDLESLVDHNLLRLESGTDDEPRYVMLEMIQEYAREQLLTTSDEYVLRQRHARFYLQLVDQTGHFVEGPAETPWLDRLEDERANLQAVLKWTLEQKDFGMLAHLCSSLGRFWWGRGHLDEGRRWLDVALEHGRALPPSVRAPLLNEAGNLAILQGDFTTATVRHEESLHLFRELGDTAGIANSLHYLGFVALFQNDARVKPRIEESLALYRDLDDPGGIALSLVQLGMVAAVQGEREQARELYQQSLSMFQEQGNTWLIASCLFYIGQLALDNGDIDQAASVFMESLRLCWSIREMVGIGICLQGLAGVLAARQPVEAVRLLGAAERVRAGISIPLMPFERPQYERTVNTLHVQLDEATFVTGWTEGQHMPLDEVILHTLVM